MGSIDGRVGGQVPADIALQFQTYARGKGGESPLHDMQTTHCVLCSISHLLVFPAFCI